MSRPSSVGGNECFREGPVMRAMAVTCEMKRTVKCDVIKHFSQLHWC